MDGDRRSDAIDKRRVAIVPMGFCYPGAGASGDLPPRPECAPLWHERLLSHLPVRRLTLLVGAHAQISYVAGRGKITVTETVATSAATCRNSFPCLIRGGGARFGQEILGFRRGTAVGARGRRQGHALSAQMAPVSGLTRSPFPHRPPRLYCPLPSARAAMAINGHRNRSFGPGGGTRRLHPSPFDQRAGFGGGEIGSTGDCKG